MLTETTITLFIIWTFLITIPLEDTQINMMTTLKHRTLSQVTQFSTLNSVNILYKVMLK